MNERPLLNPETAADAPARGLGQAAPISGAALSPRTHRVRRRAREARDVFTLELAPDDPSAHARFEPGQFAMLYAFRVGEAPISSCGESRDGFPLFTVRDVGAVTHALTRLRAGDVVGLRGPFGTGWPLEAARGRDVVLVAGGLGLPPLRSAFERLLLDRGAYGRLVLLCGARTPRDLVFRARLARWQRRADVEVRLTVDAAEPGYAGHVGVVTELLAKLALDPAQTLAFVCGPPLMMRFTARALHERGVSPDAIFLSIERNMRCAVGFCGHCQLGPYFICRDGPVLARSRLLRWIEHREL